MQLKLSDYILWVILAIPATLMLFQFLSDTGNANQLLHPSGEFSARILIIAMIATPLRLLFNSRRWTLWLVRKRRYFGVAAFGYALIHTVFYIVDVNSITVVFNELWTLGIGTGWLAFLIFVPLALTSNNISQRLLGKRWKTLQRWVYPAAVLTLMHWIFVHNNIGPALVHFVPLALLEAYRVYAQRPKSSKASVNAL